MSKIFDKWSSKGNRFSTKRTNTSAMSGYSTNNRTISRNNPTHKPRPTPGPLPPKTGNKKS